MKNKSTTATLTVIILLLFLCAGLQAQGFHVSNGRLLDGNNNDFVMRGVSHAHTWFEGRTGAFADIKSVGANAVRVVLSSGDHAEDWGRNDAADVQNVINICKQQRMIAVLEVHDTTGYGEKPGSVSLATVIAYWRDIQSVLTGEEAYILINIGNEPYGNTNYENWIGETRNAIQSMRSAGFNHTLVVDAPNWGQDWSYTMRDNAQYIYNSDPTGNTVLSIHMYGVYKNDNAVNGYISAIRNQNLPLIIGEFGHYHSDGDPDEDAIMYRAEDFNIGYFGWSWCGNSGGVEYLDMVNNWNVNSLTSWGDRIINGANGLRSKSGECSIFTGGSVTPPSEPDPTQPPPSAGSCANVPVWTPDAIYAQAGTRVQYNNMVYENNWYSQGQNPEENSGANEVWTFIGICDDGGTTPTPTTPPTQPPTYWTGDVNHDDSIDIIDALLVAQFYVGLSPSNFDESVADTSCDGIVDIVDALLIAQLYVDAIHRFEC